MRVEEADQPSQGYLVIRFTPTELKCLLADLEGKSPHHGEATKKFESVANQYLNGELRDAVNVEV